MVADPPVGHHIVLVGLPGSGKTTIGQMLAGRLGRQFVDFDLVIESRQGRTVAEIFIAEGEEYFRMLEHSLTQELRQAPAAVLAPGGGWICGPGNVELLRPPAHLVYLRVTPTVAIDRMAETVALRPLLNRHDPAGDLHRLYVERGDLYQAADLYVDTEVIEPQAVTDLLADYVRLIEAG